MSSQNYTGRPSAVLVIVILLVCVLAACAVVMMVQSMVIPEHAPTETTSSPATAGIVTQSGTYSDTTVLAPISQPTTESDTTASPQSQTDVTTAEPANTNAPVDTTTPPQTTNPPETTPPPPPIITLPKADKPADKDYFGSLLFIGDSRTQGLYIATGGYGALYFADRGLSIDGVANKKFLVQQQNDGSNAPVTVIEALQSSPHQGKIYIWLGLNELGWGAVSRFESAFRTQLSAICSACPDADIVLMSLVPVGRSAVVVGVASSTAANARIREYNDVLLRLAEEFNVYYLNCYEAFADAEGYLPNGYASDGIHLVRDRNLALCDYILAHPVPGNK